MRPHTLAQVEHLCTGFVQPGATGRVGGHAGRAVGVREGHEGGMVSDACGVCYNADVLNAAPSARCPKRSRSLGVFLWRTTIH